MPYSPDTGHTTDISQPYSPPAGSRGAEIVAAAASRAERLSTAPSEASRAFGGLGRVSYREQQAKQARYEKGQAGRIQNILSGKLTPNVITSRQWTGAATATPSQLKRAVELVQAPQQDFSPETAYREALITGIRREEAERVSQLQLQSAASGLQQQTTGNFFMQPTLSRKATQQFKETFVPKEYGVETGIAKKYQLEEYSKGLIKKKTEKLAKEIKAQDIKILNLESQFVSSTQPQPFQSTYQTDTERQQEVAGLLKAAKKERTKILAKQQLLGVEKIAREKGGRYIGIGAAIGLTSGFATPYVTGGTGFVATKVVPIVSKSLLPAFIGYEGFRYVKAEGGVAKGEVLGETLLFLGGYKAGQLTKTYLFPRPSPVAAAATSTVLVGKKGQVTFKGDTPEIVGGKRGRVSFKSDTGSTIIKGKGGEIYFKGDTPSFVKGKIVDTTPKYKPDFIKPAKIVKTPLSRSFPRVIEETKYAQVIPKRSMKILRPSGAKTYPFATADPKFRIELFKSTPAKPTFPIKTKVKAVAGSRARIAKLDDLMKFNEGGAARIAKGGVSRLKILKVKQPKIDIKYIERKSLYKGVKIKELTLKETPKIVKQPKYIELTKEGMEIPKVKVIPTKQQSLVLKRLRDTQRGQRLIKYKSPKQPLDIKYVERKSLYKGVKIKELSIKEPKIPKQLLDFDVPKVKVKLPQPQELALKRFKEVQGGKRLAELRKIKPLDMKYVEKKSLYKGVKIKELTLQEQKLIKQPLEFDIPKVKVIPPKEQALALKRFKVKQAADRLVVSKAPDTTPSFTAIERKSLFKGKTIKEIKFVEPTIPKGAKAVNLKGGMKQIVKMKPPTVKEEKLLIQELRPVTKKAIKQYSELKAKIIPEVKTRVKKKPTVVVGTIVTGGMIFATKRFEPAFYQRTDTELASIPAGAFAKTLISTQTKTQQLMETKTKTQQVSGVDFKLKLATGYSGLTIPKVEQVFEQGYKTRTGQLFIPIFETKQASKEALATLVETKAATKVMQQFKTDTATEFKTDIGQKQFYDQGQPQRYRQPTRTTTDIVTTTGGGGIGSPLKAPSRKIPIISGAKPTKAYAAFLKRKGRWYKVSKPTGLKTALDIGAERVSKTLGATFKVREVKGKARKISSTGEFARRVKEFRTYKKVKGKRVPLEELTFIQKRKFRLGTRGEVGEIQRAKSAAGYFKKSKTKGRTWL